MKKPSYLSLARKAAKIADDKKGRDIVILNVKRLTAITDYFVIVTADSTPQIRAIIDGIHRTFREEGHHPIHREGVETSTWSVLDYGGVVIHIMSPTARDLYALENIWSQGKKVK